MPLLDRPLVIAFSCARSDDQAVALLMDAPEKKPGKRACSPCTDCSLTGRIISEKVFQKKLHLSNKRFRIPVRGKTECLRDPFLSGRQKRHPSAENRCPAGFLLVIDGNALIFHLLSGQLRLFFEKTARAFFPERSQDGTFGNFSLIQGIFKTEPEIFVKFIPAAGMVI